VSPLPENFITYDAQDPITGLRTMDSNLPLVLPFHFFTLP
jgi:hypothetical protein